MKYFSRMKLRATLLLAAVLMAARAPAATPPEKIWQPAASPPEFPHETNSFPAVPESDWKISFTTHAGDVWLGGDHRLSRQHRGQWSLFTSTNQLGPESPIAFAETPDARVWCATPESVWQFDGRNWLETRAGLERVHGLLAARDGTLWVATFFKSAP